MRKFLRDNGLSLVMFGLFVLCLFGQALTGWHQDNDERRAHHLEPQPLLEYLDSGDFVEATFENWESEFFQMTALMILSATLVQKGSAQSKDPAEKDDQPPPSRRSPWPVRHGGLVKQVYARSLSLALGALFIVSFALHGLGGRKRFNLEAVAHGQPTVTLSGYLTSSTFWFESFQNWQSEFLSIGVLVVLSIVLRQEGSPESKPVAAPHAKTGA